MNAQILAEIDRILPMIADAMSKFTEEDWDRVLVGAYKLTAEVKVERANKPAGPWLLSR